MNICAKTMYWIHEGLWATPNQPCSLIWTMSPYGFQVPPPPTPHDYQMTDWTKLSKQTHPFHLSLKTQQSWEYALAISQDWGHWMTMSCNPHQETSILKEQKMKNIFIIGNYTLNIDKVCLQEWKGIFHPLPVITEINWQALTYYYSDYSKPNICGHHAWPQINTGCVNVRCTFWLLSITSFKHHWHTQKLGECVWVRWGDC